MASFRSDSTRKTNVHPERGHARSLPGAGSPRRREALAGSRAELSLDGRAVPIPRSRRAGRSQDEGPPPSAAMIGGSDRADARHRRGTAKRPHDPPGRGGRGARIRRACGLAPASIHEGCPALPAAAAARLQRPIAGPEAPEGLTPHVGRGGHGWREPAAEGLRVHAISRRMSSAVRRVATAPPGRDSCGACPPVASSGAPA